MLVTLSYLLTKLACVTKKYITGDKSQALVANFALFVTNIICSTFLNKTFSQYKLKPPTSQICHQHRNFVTQIKSLTSRCRQHHDISNSPKQNLFSEMELYRISYHQKWSKPKSVLDPVAKTKPNSYHSEFILKIFRLLRFWF